MSSEMNDIPLFELPEHEVLAYEELYILGFNVERLMTQKGYNIRELARMAGLSHPVIYDILRGDKNPQSHSVLNVAKALGVSTAYLYTPPLKNVDLYYYRDTCKARAKARKEHEFGARKPKGPQDIHS